MGAFDILNTATGGKAQEVVDTAVSTANATANLKDLDPSYGAGVMVPNPDYQAWLQRKQALEQQYGQLSTAAQYSRDPGAQQAAQRVKAQIDALGPPPPQQIQRSLAQDEQAVREAGAEATQRIRSAAETAQVTGNDAAVRGHQAAEAANQQAAAAQQRTAPTLEGADAARAAQADALGAAKSFEPNLGVSDLRKAGTGGAQAITQAGQAGTGRLDAFQASREGVNALQALANRPGGPSAAESMLRLQAARDRAAAISRARSVRGGPGAVAEAMKIAQAEGAAMAADTRGQMAVIRAQEAAQLRGEQLQATTSAASLLSQNEAQRLQAAQASGQLGVQAAQAAGQLDVGAQQAVTQAKLDASAQDLQAIGLQQQGANAMRTADIEVAKANLGAELQTMGMNDEQTRFFAGLAEQARQAGINANLQAQQLGVSAETAAAGVALQTGQQAWQMLTTEQQMQLTRMGIERGVIQANQQNQQAQNQQSMQFLGTLLMAGASVASDRRAKRDIKKAKSMAEALRRTPGSHYRYKDDKHGKGEHTGPMAQDLEKTREFKSAVVERGGIKTVDSGRLVMAHHAALSDLQRQIDRLEKLGRRKGAAA